MEFLTPLMLVGLAGVALPVLIHLIGRRRARRVRFAALDFLLGSDRKVARRLRLRELLLLAARILACVAVPLALAKPYTSCQARGPLVERGAQAAVLVVDNSIASSYQIDGESLLSRSRERARAILDQLGPEAEVAVLTTAASDAAGGPGELSRDHIRLRDRIRDIAPAARPADLTTALRRAGQLLAGSSQPLRTVYLLGLPAAAAVRTGEVPWPAGPHAPVLRLVDPTGGAALDDLAVTRLSIESDSEAGARGVAITAEVANTGAHPAADRAVSLRIAGRVVARGLVSVPAGQRVKKRFTAVLPAGTRHAKIAVELSEGDGLRLDDRRYAQAELRQEIPILLVDGDPRTVRYEDELFYLGAALRPGDRSDSGAVTTVTTSDDLAGKKLEDFAVVVLANVRPLPREVVARLSQWVEAGGGLMMAMGDNVNVDRYNKEMAPLLPQALAGVIDLVHGTEGGERRGRALHLAKVDLDHPIFSVFSQNAPGLEDAAFSRVVLLGPTTQVGKRQVLARYDNGNPALVEAEVGKGRILLYTSTIDRDWNDLPIHPGFLPLVQQAVRHLAGVSQRAGGDDTLVGQPLLLDVPAGTSRVEITSPGQHRAVIEGERLADRRQVRFAATDAPGFYRVVEVARGEPGATELQRTTAQAVNLDPAGSELARADAAALSGPAAAAAAPAPAAVHQRRVELWHAVALALLLFLLTESFLVWRR